MKEKPNYADFSVIKNISTRWHDNDIYGHVNNVIYYSFFDTAVNEYLIESGLDIHEGQEIAFVVNSTCSYFQPLAYPEKIQVGLGIEKIGNSSVTYRLAIFNAQQECCATGSFTHVFVNRSTNKSIPMPDSIRSALEKLNTIN